MAKPAQQVDSFNNQGNNGKIGFTEKLGYGFGDMASNIIVTAATSFLTFFYTNVVGASAAAIGTIMLLSRIFDGATDLGMGVLIDKTKSKHGKARPWILWMAIPMAIITILTFAVPQGWSETGKLVYIAITYNLLFLVYTAINVPYGTLNSMITQDQHQRSILNLFRMSMALATAIIITNVTMPIVNVFGGGQSGWVIAFAIFSAVGVGLFLITFFTTKERVRPAQLESASTNIPMKEGIKALFKNKYWVIMVIIMVTVFVFFGVITGVTIYYAQYLLGDPGLVGLLTMVLLIPAVAAMFVLSPILKKFGKRNTMMGGLILIILGSLLMLVNPENLILIYVATALRGIGFAPLVGTIFAMLADTIEYGEWKTGLRTEGLVYSGGSFGTKVGGGLGSALIGWILAAGGFISDGNATQPESAIFAIQFMFTWVPIIISAIMLLILPFYKLDKMYPQIVKDLQERNS
ncbi:MFS transporter [Aquibacillus albus]|uniref:GPH family glycoside/pentoside/hexuronide:cation symporter n=1 Tax=Aquibacillus albus TaxID=1168171 RepID=A0ABS2MXG2_9BACI|nr:MFS transporter [Aquibacillus albus]MBM7570575.1 GPH family glycoside/pentoside/hexuronide:cation symporter [Aquibacillus albus]